MGLRKLKNSIGKKIKALRIENSISQEKLAEYIDMSREHISRIEQGKNMPTVETLYKLSQYFNLSIKYFFD